MCPSSTARIAGSASGCILINHCSDKIGSTTVLQRLQTPMLRAYSSSFSKRPGAKVVEDLFASFVTVHAFVRAAILRDARLFIQNPQFRQVVALSYAVVIRIVRGSNFHSAGAKLRIDKFIGDDRDHAFEQRKHKPAANGPAISLI